MYDKKGVLYLILQLGDTVGMLLLGDAVVMVHQLLLGNDFMSEIMHVNFDMAFVPTLGT